MKIGITERGDAGLDFNMWQRKMKSVNAAILITKRPNILVDRIAEIPDNTIIHCSITGLSGSIFEPNSIPIDQAINTWQHLVNMFGERVVLRIDPIIPTKWTEAVSIIKHVGNNRLRISFLDLYPHVSKRLQIHQQELLNIKQYYPSGIHASITSRKWMMKEIIKLAPQVEVCAEPGIIGTGCISNKDLELLNLPISDSAGFQRPNCKCCSAKTELLIRKHPCPNGCLYCYWK